MFSIDLPKISRFELSLTRPTMANINVLEYNNENMRFIRLLLANQIAYIFRSNDKLK